MPTPIQFPTISPDVVEKMAQVLMEARDTITEEHDSGYATHPARCAHTIALIDNILAKWSEQAT